MGVGLPGRSDVDQAIALWRARDPRFAALLVRHDTTARALRHYGLILWEGGDPQAAAEVLTAAVALAPEDVRVWTDLSGAFNAAGQLPQAAACIEEALRRDEAHADGWLRLGSIRNAEGDPVAAESALRTALRLDPALLDARLNLGLICFQAKRFPEAVDHLRAVTEHGTTVAIQNCYGQALSHTGAFEEAAAAFRLACDEQPDDEPLALKYAQARFIGDVAIGDLDEAIAACLARPFVGATAFETISRRAFHLLSAFGYEEAAIRLGERRLADKPEDPERAYLLSVLRGDPLACAPDSYVTSFFDRFAEEFDKQLVDVLGYSGFRQLADLAEEHASGVRRILDLGCGTGLAGPLLARPGRCLVGVDLSSGMLGKARARGCYDELVTAEASAYLAGKTEAFDLVFAADMLIYIGDLAPVIALVAAALRPGGLFALTIETTDADFALLASGRFAHGLAHVLALAEAAAFIPLATRSIPIRYETQGYVAGELILLRKRGAEEERPASDEAGLEQVSDGRTGPPQV